MNNIQTVKIIVMMICTILNLLSCSSNKYDSTINKMQARNFTESGNKQTLPYRLFIPENYNSNSKYPLILILHGGGERGNDNKSQISIAAKTFIENYVQDRTPCFVLVPQCPKGTQWLNTTFKKTPFSNYRQDEIPESSTMKIVIKIIKSLEKEFNIDSGRIYVTGYSMGGSGTWDIITRYPGMFAAAVPVTGVSDPTKAKKISHMPIWAFHGSKDTVTPVQVTKNMISELKKTGSTCRFTEYKNVGHDSWNKAYKNDDMFTWLFEQKKQ